MHALILTLALSQTPPGWTEPQLNGIYSKLAQVQQQIEAGSKPTKTRPTKFTYGGNVGKGKNCMVCRGWLISPDMAVKLGIDPALYTRTVTGPATGQTTTQIVTARLYANLMVCAGESQTKADKPSWLAAAITETCSAPISSDPGQDAFRVALIDDTESQSAATGSGCACATGPNCTWTTSTPGGGTQTVTCPRNLTLAPGTWSGTDVVRKTCIEWAGTGSMPSACVP